MLKQLFYHGPSFAVLHEEYAKKGRIDDQAPIRTSGAITIDAPIERVWNLLADLPAWPAIDPSFRNVRLESTVAVDARFRFVLNNFPISAQFAVVNPCRQLSWTGLSLWFKAVDLHILEPAPGGGTRLFVAESLSGVLATLFISSARLKAQHDRWLRGFKQAAEAPA